MFYLESHFPQGGCSWWGGGDSTASQKRSNNNVYPCTWGWRGLGGGLEWELWGMLRGGGGGFVHYPLEKSQGKTRAGGLSP